ncbi:electron transfer flavoprotein subunit beta/FixA family protein [Brevibacterium sp. UCMA 11752]|uniref:electron transfer flavoprotein subunit beta/FixA family protein n=1 Tax=Brevibacterium sp. UCMA 11752 TaxID=2745946 RepID=UPI001F2DECA6|nr:electron transfer flavoprotein subunit beta/FixA family protein [Brevibacterium sp. UCMA 11752]MCF2585959.1 electron transfer flavoprotein subunit beta/FixA family protein [Brevibacterium sp. UCMA 11752]
MDILVCIKRIPDISGQITLDASGTDIDDSGLGHTTSAHEECAVELAIQTAAATGGKVTVLTLGPAEAVEQLRAAVGVGANDGILIETEEPGAFGPEDIAQVIGDVIRDRAEGGQSFDLVLLGNDAADTGDFQVPIRLAYDLEYPVLTGIQTLSASTGSSSDRSGSSGGGSIEARGIGPAGTEIFSLELPAVIAVQEGGVDPRYPSITGRMKAKKARIAEYVAPEPGAGNPRIGLELPPDTANEVTILGEGPDAAGALVDVLEEIGVIRS